MAMEHEQLHTGGCLCGALRYEAYGAPVAMGHCYCADCRKASGSGFIPFMSFRREAIHITGACLTFISKSARGADAHRNSCPVCASLVFGGERDKSDSFTIYAGSLDDPAPFAPQLAIFTRGRPDWAVIPPGIQNFEAMPT